MGKYYHCFVLITRYDMLLRNVFLNLTLPTFSVTDFVKVRNNGA
jgi:hypothetical protein